MAKVYTEEVDIERVKVDIKSGEEDIESTNYFLSQIRFQKKQ